MNNTMKTLVKNGKRIKGFVYQNKEGFWYAFGKPSQDNWIAFSCNSIEQGIARIELHSNLTGLNSLNK